jgi:hypothetical protein
MCRHGVCGKCGKRAKLPNEAEEATESGLRNANRVAGRCRPSFRSSRPRSRTRGLFCRPRPGTTTALTPFEQRFAKLEQDVRLQVSSAAIAVHGAPIVAEMEKSIEKAMQKNHPDMQRSCRANENIQRSRWRRYELVQAQQALGRNRGRPRCIQKQRCWMRH